MSELDTANAIQPAGDKERKSSLVWLLGALVIGVIALFVAGALSLKTHKAEVAKIESAPVEFPPIKPELKKKDATKNVANKATNTQPTVEFSSTVQKSTEPLSQFEIDVIAFETKVKKDFP